MIRVADLISESMKVSGTRETLSKEIVIIEGKKKKIIKSIAASSQKMIIKIGDK